MRQLIQQRYRLLLMFLITGVLYWVPVHSQDATIPPQQYLQFYGEPAWDGTYRRIHVPILMYHYVSEAPENADEMRRQLTLSPTLFRQHLEYFFYEGYTPISLYALNNALLTGASLPAKPVILTFDDGYIDHYSIVFPMLRQYGFTATFFIITGQVDANNPAYMNWAQVSEMANAGMDMEAHTKTHAELDNRDYDFLVYEVLGSLESLQVYTGRPSRMFSYPVGSYDDNTLSTLATMPIWRAVTTQPGALHTSDNRLEMTRLRITHETGVNGLQQLLGWNS